MLDSPATNNAQHGEMIWARAGQGAVNTRTRARMTARSLWPSIQLLVVLSRFANLFMTSLPSPLLVLQQVHEDPAQLRRVGGVLFAKRVAMCEASCFLAQFGGQQLLRQGLSVDTGGDRRRGQERGRTRGCLARRILDRIRQLQFYVRCLVASLQRLQIVERQCIIHVRHGAVPWIRGGG